MDAEERAAEILDAWATRLKRGDYVDPAEILDRHPDLAVELRRGFAAVHLVDLALEPEAEADVGIPESIGPYRIEAVLGVGGMGTVYRGVASEPTGVASPGTPVALKVIHPHLLQKPGFFKRFMREAALGRSVKHENVVRTYDVDALESGESLHHFLAMEYVEGRTLLELLEELGRVPEELCRHVGREVAKGLAAIHEAGAIHRDLKPENVLITSDHVVKVMDLGVARLMDEQVRLSQTGVFVGSILYAAPEQFQSIEPDARCDLYALGLVLYELATGQHPFRADDASQVLRSQLEAEPRRAGEVNPQLSPFFEEVCHALLAKRREDRIQSAADLARILEESDSGAWWQDRARTIRSETQRPLRRVRVPRETALYGREDALELLEGLYARAREGSGQMVLLHGEAGIGKTRLVDEFVARLREDGEDLDFLFGSYPPGGAATSSDAFFTAYREHLGAGNLEEALDDHLGETPLLAPAFAALLRGESVPTGEEPLNQHSLQTCFARVTRSIAARRTTVVLIDDLHFAPDEGRALFASLALALAGHRILLIGTMRPGVSQTWIANIVRLEHATRHELGRLGAKDLAHLLREAFQSDRLAEELGFRIVEKSDGNPFFVFEILQGLREGQFITQRPDGSWVTSKVIHDIQVPSTVSDLIEARLRDLSEEERELLDVASCCGFEFDPIVVADVLDLQAIPALRAFARLESLNRLVRSAGAVLVFDHHQVQETLYAGLLSKLRTRYHAAIGDAMAGRAGLDVVDDVPGGASCVALCDHYLRGEQGRKALRFLDPALEHLADGYLNVPAIELADRALEVPGLLEGTARAEVLLQKVERLNLLGRRDEQRAVLAEAADLARDLEPGIQLRIERAAGWMSYVTGRHAEARAHYQRQRELAQEQDEIAGATVNLGNVCLALGEYEDALALYREGERLAHACGHVQYEANARANQGVLYQHQGRHAEAEELHAKHLAFVRDMGDLRGEGRAACNLGLVLGRRGRLEEAEAHHARHLAISRQIGDRQGEAFATGNLGLVYQSQGRVEEALAHYERHILLSQELGDPYGEARGWGNLGYQTWLLGRFEKAKPCFERSLTIALETGDRLHVAQSRGNLGRAARALGRYGEAQRQFQQQLELVREMGNQRDSAWAAISLAEVFLRVGGHDAARELLEEGHRLATHAEDRACVAEGRAFQGDLELAEGRREEAGEHYAWYRAYAEDVDSDPSRCTSAWRNGRLAQVEDRREDCARWLGEAARLAAEVEDRDILIVAEARRATLEGGDVERALVALQEVGDRAEVSSRMDATLHLFRASGRMELLEEAKRLLDELVEHAPEAHRESMLTDVPLNREIVEAWAARPTPGG